MRRHVIPDVVSGQIITALPKTATVSEAASTMSSREISAVLVMDGEALEGIFTVRDLARRVVGSDLGLETQLAEVMTANPQTIDAQELPLRGLRQMHDSGFRHLPVVDTAGKVVGVVSRRDFFREDEELLEQETSLWEHL